MLASQLDSYRRTGTVLVEAVDGTVARSRDSLLYPEGGGQPSDQGTLGEAVVLDVQRRDGWIEHTLDRTLAPGEHAVEVDWARRFDHMQQHTAQHLLTALALERYDLPTTSFHLPVGTDRVCTLELGGSLSDDQLPALEGAVADAIRRALPVSALEHPPDATGVRSRGLPADHVGPVRVVSIGSLDHNTCGGTHVANTAELEVVLLLGVQRTTRGCRLPFVAGCRARAAARTLQQRERALVAALQVPAEDLLDSVRRAQRELASTRAGVEALQRELARLQGERLVGEVAHLHLERGDAKQLARIAAHASAEVVWLTAAPDAFLLRGPVARVTAARDAILDLLQARGGGRPGTLQGRAEALDRRDEVLHLLRLEHG